MQDHDRVARFIEPCRRYEVEEDKRFGLIGSSKAKICQSSA
jgi:hypothetical protein